MWLQRAMKMPAQGTMTAVVPWMLTGTTAATKLPVGRRLCAFATASVQTCALHAALPGLDYVCVKGDSIEHATIYFDVGALSRQSGLTLQQLRQYDDA